MIAGTNEGIMSDRGNIYCREDATLDLAAFLLDLKSRKFAQQCLFR